MSYEPTIIIKKEELDKHEEELDKAYYKDGDKALKYLRTIHLEYLKSDIPAPKIDGIELILCKPELTSFNELVRDKLTELDVQYTTDN